MLRRSPWLGVLAATLLLIVSVTPAGAAGDASTSHHGGRSQAQVRVAHFSPDAPNVDVYVNRHKTLSNVPYKVVSDYLSVRPGRYRFDIRPAGAPATSKPVLSASAMLLPGQAYTVAAVGPLASISTKVYRDAVCAPDPGMAKVRAIHAAPDVPAVDVTLPDGTVLIANLSFPRASRYLEVPAGAYTLQVRLAGTSTVALTIPATVDAGNIYTIAVVGQLANGTVMPLPIVDAKDVKDPTKGPRAHLCRAA